MKISKIKFKIQGKIACDEDLNGIPHNDFLPFPLFCLDFQYDQQYHSNYQIHNGLILLTRVILLHKSSHLQG